MSAIALMPDSEAGWSETHHSSYATTNQDVDAVSLSINPDHEYKVELVVSGYGFFGNRRLMRKLEVLIDMDTPPRSYITAAQIEDAAHILMALVQEDGYLRPKIEAHLIILTGERGHYVWDERLATTLPWPTRATRVEFQVHSGILYHFGEIHFDGLTAITEEASRKFFVAEDFLFRTRRMRRFIPARLNRAVRNLREAVVRLGYERATVDARHEANHHTGEVEIWIAVHEGQRSIIRSAHAKFAPGVEGEGWEIEVEPGQPYSRIWVQDVAQTLRTDYFARGHPDTEVRHEIKNREDGDGVVYVDLVFHIDPGPYVETGEVEFRGHEKTLERPLRRRLDLNPGDPLNLGEVDRARFRLARLGIFESIDVEFDEVAENRRDIIFHLEEGHDVDVNLLFGYGSWEMLRGGVEVEQFNVFGRAHRSRLLLTQSFRSSSATYSYRVPELFGEDLQGFSQLFGLRREERAFDRVEFGATVGLQKFLSGIDTEAGARYTLQELQARPFAPVEGEGVERARVAAFGLDFRRDRRDNPIYPESGHTGFLNLELASQLLGGEVNYKRLEFGGTWHRPIGGGRTVHASLHHGFVYTIGVPAEDLPFNRRFFMGGESTVRGFLHGEASPRDARGEIVGAESHVLANLEIEQALTPQWSAVVFSDSIGFARRVDDYPFDDGLFSVGAGIRYKTVVGPIRLEYGYNLNPRPQDRRWAVHLSFGFPF